MTQPDLEQIKDQIIEKLLSAHFHILYYESMTTKSHYIKIDYDICNSIRISDHNGKKKLIYRYNVLQKNTGRKENKQQKYIRYFYGTDSIHLLIRDINQCLLVTFYIINKMLRFIVVV